MQKKSVLNKPKYKFYRRNSPSKDMVTVLDMLKLKWIFKNRAKQFCVVSYCNCALSKMCVLCELYCPLFLTLEFIHYLYLLFS